MQSIAQLTKYRQRYVLQRAQRNEWLAEERNNMQVIEDGMREIKICAAPYIAVGDVKVVGIVDELEDGIKKLKEERLKGIPEPEITDKQFEWFYERCDALWKEKLSFGYRRKQWERVIKSVESQLDEVRNMPPPTRQPAVAAAAAVPPTSELSLDLDMPAQQSISNADDDLDLDLDLGI